MRVNGPHRTLTVAVSLNPFAEQTLGALAREFRAGYTRLPGPGLGRLVPPAGTSPCLPFDGSAWRPFIGGALLSTRTMSFWALVGVPEHLVKKGRVVVQFTYAHDAQRVWSLDQSSEYVRRTAWLIEREPSVWVLRMRWDQKDRPMVRYGNELRPRKLRKHRRRWAIAPPEWPRNKYGRPVSTTQATRLLGKHKVEQLLLFR